MNKVGVKSSYTLWVKPIEVPQGCQIKVGDKLLVEDDNGKHLVETVVLGLQDSKTSDLKFIKVADEHDIKSQIKNISKLKYAQTLCNKHIQELALDMQLKKVYVNFDASKVIFYFTSDTRVDFRELVKRLASALARTRIEMRQISEREEVALMGGVGACGRICCCTSFLEDFGKVSIKMAKNQGIALNPNKINGYCGKLLCCLGYENSAYLEAMKTMPKVGSQVMLPDGSQGIVHYNHLIKKIVRVKVQEGDAFAIKDCALEELLKCNDSIEFAGACPHQLQDDGE